MDNAPEINPLQEIEAMRGVATALEPLSEDSRKRVIAWAAAIYGARIPVTPGGSHAQSPAVGNPPPPPGATEYDTFAELFDAAAPRTEFEKALVGGYWLKKHENMATFDSMSVNRELKHLGHAVANITAAFDDLKEQKPALAVQTAKSGKSQQARKKYMITTAGDKYVEQMLRGERNGAD